MKETSLLATNNIRSEKDKKLKAPSTSIVVTERRNENFIELIYKHSCRVVNF